MSPGFNANENAAGKKNTLQMAHPGYSRRVKTNSRRLQSLPWAEVGIINQQEEKKKRGSLIC